MKHSRDDDLSTASSILIVYSALLGMCAFFMMISTVVTWPPDSSSIYPLVILLAGSLLLAAIAWGIRKEKPWAWPPALAVSGVFSLAFPIGTLVSYHAIQALMRLQESSAKAKDEIT